MKLSMLMRLFALLSISAAMVEAQASWNRLAGTWTDEGNAWDGTLPQVAKNVWHFGPARLWAIPVNSGSYVVTSRVYVMDKTGCGHVFKYKMGSVRTQSKVTKAWGYFISRAVKMAISSDGTEFNPKVDFSFSSDNWYTQKSVVNGTNVKIYIDDQLVKEITMIGERADSNTDNYVGLWCHRMHFSRGDSFTVSVASCPRLSLSSNMTAYPSTCAQGDSPVGATCSFSCARGYHQTGPQSINCTDDGTWTDQSANCEDVDECLTDNGGCSHACTNTPGAYRCTCPDAVNLGPDNHTCEADGITVNCGKGHMSITLPKSLLRGVERHQLRLLNTSCQANETASHYTLKTPLTGCNTTSRHTNAAVVYSNKVLEIPTDQEAAIVRRSRGTEIPFSCYYDNEGVVSAVGLEPSGRKLVYSKVGLGNFSLSLEIFPDELFTTPFSNDDFPVAVRLGQRLYFQVSVTSADNRLSILADRCFATPTQDSNGPIRYEFISLGCSEDYTVRFHPSLSGHDQRFSVEAFEFIANNPFVFIHCEVKICNATDPYSQCNRVCPSRVKRAVGHVPSDGNPLYSLAQGPLVLEQNTEHELVKNFASNGASANQLMTLALLCVVYLSGTAAIG